MTSRGHPLEEGEIRGELTVVRPAVEGDADLLARWHDDPEVARYWDEERFTRQEMRERLLRGDVDAFVVEENGNPVGYLQAWRAGDDGGIDMFLIPSARGRALGPDAARAFARHLVDERGWAVSPSIRTSGTRRPCAPGAVPASATSRNASRTPSTRPAGC